MKQLIGFTWGLVFGFTAFSVARASLTEIKGVHKQGKPELELNIAREIDQLSRMEDRYHDKKIPSVANQERLKGPIQRISKQKYRYSKSK